MLSDSPSPFPWLPPLNSHPNYAIHITAQQKESRHDYFFMDSSSFPEFVVDFYVQADFYSEDQSKKIPIRGLDVDRTFFITCYPGDSEPMQETEIQFMFRLMRIPFPLNNLRWETTDDSSSSEDNNNSSPETVLLESEDELNKTILGFMNNLKNLPINEDRMFLPVCLKIVKKITISDFEFEAWMSWQEEQARVNPNFHAEYLKAIQRPRLRTELLDRAAQAATASSVAALESWEIGAGSSPITCSICLEEVLFGMTATRMPCSHVFHGDCILKWLKGEHTCPLCRYSLPFTNP